jgi:phage gp16-like protein
MNHHEILRRRELAKIHVAKKQLGLDDGTYREMLHAVAGVRTLTPERPGT